MAICSVQHKAVKFRSIVLQAFYSVSFPSLRGKCVIVLLCNPIWVRNIGSCSHFLSFSFAHTHLVTAQNLCCLMFRASLHGALAQCSCFSVSFFFLFCIFFGFTAFFLCPCRFGANMFCFVSVVVWGLLCPLPGNRNLPRNAEIGMRCGYTVGFAKGAVHMIQ